MPSIKGSGIKGFETILTDGKQNELETKRKLFCSKLIHLIFKVNNSEIIIHFYKVPILP